MDAQTLSIISILLTLVIGGYILYKRVQGGEVVNNSSVVTSSVLQAVPVAKELMEITQIAVNATEQLRREGKIETHDEAFNHALDLVKKWIPDNWKVDNIDIINSINAAVLVASSLTSQIKADNSATPIKD